LGGGQILGKFWANSGPFVLDKSFDCFGLGTNKQ